MFYCFKSLIIEFIGLLIDMAESTIGYIKTESDVRADVSTALQNANTQIEEAADFLLQIQARLAAIRANRDGGGNVSRIRVLSTRIDSALGSLQGYAQSFTGGVAEIREGVNDLTNRIRRAIRMGAVTVSVLLLWVAAGQVSLAVHGWGLVRPARRDVL